MRVRRRRRQADTEVVADAAVIVVDRVSVRFPRIDRDRLSRWLRRSIAALRRRFPRVLRFGRPQTQALVDVSMRVEAGELIVLLGRNGSGKTTLLQALAGLTWVDDGRIVVAGMNPWKGRKAWRTQVGFVPQELGLELDATVDELMRRSARLYPDPHPISGVLARLDLDRQSLKFVRALSGGQRRKLEIALSLVGRPRVLLLDEPFNDLDPETRRELWSALAGERDRGTAIVLSTHQIHEVAPHASRVVVLAGGFIVADARPDELAHGGSLETAYLELSRSVERQP